MTRSKACTLVRSCAVSREAETWQRFLNLYGYRLAAAVRRALARAGVGASREKMEDLLQEVYCRLLERDGKVLRSCRGEKEAEVASYLTRIAESVVVDQLRLAATLKRGGGRPPASAVHEPGVAHRIADPRESPERRLAMRECRERLFTRCAEALRHRPRRELLVVYLAFFEGWSSREIAGSLGNVAPGTVDSLIYRVKIRLARAGLCLPDRTRLRTLG